MPGGQCLCFFSAVTEEFEHPGVEVFQDLGSEAHSQDCWQEMMLELARARAGQSKQWYLRSKEVGEGT